MSWYVLDHDRRGYVPTFVDTQGAEPRPLRLGPFQSYRAAHAYRDAKIEQSRKPRNLEVVHDRG